MPRQTRYPMGPLSLAQLEAFERSPAARRGEDAYDVGVRAVAENGVYPTFGHVDCRHRRWYRDLWGPREQVIGILSVPARYR